MVAADVLGRGCPHLIACRHGWKLDGGPVQMHTARGPGLVARRTRRKRRAVKAPEAELPRPGLLASPGTPLHQFRGALYGSACAPAIARRFTVRVRGLGDVFGRGKPPCTSRRITFFPGDGVCRVVAWQDAVESAGDGCALLLEVTPGAKRSEFPTGYNEWRGRITLRVHAPPQEGRANRDVCQAVAHFFQVPPSRVSIEAGHSDSRKRVAVEGLQRDEAVARLSEALGAPA